MTQCLGMPSTEASFSRRLLVPCTPQWTVISCFSWTILVGKLLVRHPDAPQIGAGHVCGRDPNHDPGHGEGGRRVHAVDPGVRLAASCLGLRFCNRKCVKL